MLYGEFIERVGCEDTLKSHQIYKDIRQAYIESSISMIKVCRFGKELVDISKTENEIEFEKRCKAEIDHLKHNIHCYRAENHHLKKCGRSWRDQIEYNNAMIAEEEAKIRFIKTMFS